LLAGNVSAVIANGGLTLQGDSASNSVTVVFENSNVIVRGLDGTTINGGSSDFVAATGSNGITDRLFASLGQGDDVLLLSGVAVGRRVTVFGQQGNDQIGLDNVSVGRHLMVWSGAGDDTVSLNSSTVSGRTSLATGAGDDLVRLVDSSVGMLVVTTAAGNDNVVLDNVQVARHGRVVSGADDDTLNVTGSQFGRTMRVNMQRGTDVMQMDTSSVGRRTVIHGGGGNDSVSIGASNSLARLVTRTGAGNDAVEVDSTTTTSGRRRVTGSESATVDADLLDTRLNDATTGALTQSANAQTLFESLLGNTAPVTSQIADISVQENAANSVVDLFAAFNDSQDADVDLTFAISSNTNSGLFTSTGIDATSGQLTLDYAADTTGSAAITVQATDTEGLSSTTTFTVTVTAPVATPNSFDVLQTASAGQVLGQVTAGSVQSSAVYQLEDSSAAAELQLNADDHLSGATAAKVVLVEYLDLQCPICRTYHPIIQQLKQDFSNDLLVVTRHLPLPSIHPNAEAAAIAAEAAGRQGMFDEMVDTLFDNQTEWAGVTDPTSLFSGYASDLGLNTTQFASDIADTALADRASRDTSAAGVLGATGTPTFFLQGTTVSPAATQSAFGAVINQAIADFNSAAVPFVVNHETGNVQLTSGVALNATTTPQYTINVRATDSAGNTQVVPVSIQVTSGT